MRQKIFSICILIGLLCIRAEAGIEADSTKTEQRTYGQLIKHIKIINNQKIDESAILHEVSSQPGSQYDEAVVQRDQDKIVELYRRYGYFQTKATVISHQLAEGVALTFDISEGNQAIIGNILFEGNRIADDTKLFNQIEETKEGRKYAPQKLNDDIIRLKEYYKWEDGKEGKFRHSDGAMYSYPTVQIKSNVEYIPAENKVIIKISIVEGVNVTIQFSGNKHIKSKNLLKDLPLLERGNLSRFTLKKSVATIEGNYKKKGYYLVKVTYEMIPKPPQEFIFNFHIDEGKPIYIGEIRFEGNNSIPAKKLRKYIATKPRSFLAGVPILRRWVAKGIYDEDNLTTDIHALNLLYEQQGYHQVKIANLKDIQPKIIENRIHLSIPIDEGPQLLIEKPPKVEFIGEEARGTATKGQQESKGATLSENNIRENLTTKEGQPYNPDILSKDEIYLRSKYGEEGYVYAKIESSFHGGIVTFKIDEGKRAYLSKLRFFGNEKTKENVLKREFLVKEGEPFNTTKIAKTQQRLYALGLFSSVDFESPGMNIAEERLDLFVRLKERKMNSFYFSGGYNPSEGYRGSIESFYKNLFGRGQQLGIKLSQGRRGSRYEVNFMEPWLLNTRTRSMMRIFRDNLEEQDDVLVKGGSASFARDWNLASIALKYQYQLIDQSELKKDEPLSTISSVELSFRRDSRDFILSPTKGWLHEFNFEYAGGPLLRGDNSFYKLSSDIRYHQQISKSSVLAFALRAGRARGLRLTKDIISLERFRAGGSTTIRGYEEDSLGPGDIKFIFNAELRFPIYNVPLSQAYLPKKIGGVVFFDTGNIWDEFKEIKKPWVASSIGAGLWIGTPIGPVRLDYGYPLGEVEKGLRLKWWQRFALGYAF
ncbi:outer membrane protein assembly factor BamA [Candidatus Poribacteria bacterium]|nr:outer membrane protein assembly factor BamA [Candidatus Poribacteria bacterium]